MPIDRCKDPQVMGLLDSVMEASHGELLTAEVTVGVEWAVRKEGDESDKPALTDKEGYPAVGRMRITPLKERLWNVPDAVLTIDREWWYLQDDEEQAAFLDRELQKIMIARDKDGCIRSDDVGRPVLAKRLYDVKVGWFLAVADRHGPRSIEVKQAREIREKYGQLLFGFADTPALAGADSSH